MASKPEIRCSYSYASVEDRCKANNCPAVAVCFGVEEYVPWVMEKTGNKVTVDAEEWSRENRPDWIEKEREGGSEES